jgi:hypothetical protein
MGMYRVKAKVQIEVDMIVSDPCAKNEEDAKQCVRDHILGSTPTFFKSVDLKLAMPTSSDSWEVQQIRQK